MKAEHINPFLESAINLFNQTFAITPEVSKPYVLTDIGNHRWEISGVMVLTGTAIGVVAIRLTRFLTNKLLERSGLEFSSEEERNNLITDMVSELVNVIAGNAATRLTNFNIKVSVPFVVQGENHTISWPERSPIIAIPFLTNFGPFAVYVSIIEK